MFAKLMHYPFKFPIRSDSVVVCPSSRVPQIRVPHGLPLSHTLPLGIGLGWGQASDAAACLRPVQVVRPVEVATAAVPGNIVLDA